MQYLDWIIKIAAVLGAIGTIIGVFIKIRAYIKKVVMEKIDEILEHNKKNYMAILRLTIMSAEMPIGERINAGYEYLKRGGNGEIKKFLESEFNITDTVETAPHYKK